MYGLVNKAVEDLVKTNFGEETWEKIKALNLKDSKSGLSRQAEINARKLELVNNAINLDSIVTTNH
jgi:hypothetical protein